MGLIFDMLSDCYNLLFLPVFIVIAVATPFVIALRLFLRYRSRRNHAKLWERASTDSAKPVVIGFFHPYCNAGGGGERVLWCGIRSLQRRYNFVRCVVYTGDTAKPDEILNRAIERFNIRLHEPVEFVYLSKRNWVEAKVWPYFTLLGQSLGSILLGFEAIWKCVPDIYIDTMGYAFTLPLFRFLGGCKVSCYVHYPTISTDMLSKVRSREKAFNNANFVSNSKFLTYCKLLYYKLFAFMYGLAGKSSHIIMVNSSWTRNHIVELWQKPNHTSIVYPPCDTTSLLCLPSLEAENENQKRIISIGQFRPEKNHLLQLEAFREFLNRVKPKSRKSFKLALVGSCRNDEDAARVDSLICAADDLGLVDYVEFHMNISFDELKKQLSKSTVGIHTMWNEHFGIGVVEFMAAGLIPLAHDSGGPKLDIVIPWNGSTTGFLASDIKTYSHAMEIIFRMSSSERIRIRENARKSVETRFSEETFESEFLRLTETLLRI